MTDEVRRLDQLARTAARDNTPEARFAAADAALADLKEDGLVLLVWVRDGAERVSVLTSFEGHGNDLMVLSSVDGALSAAERHFEPRKTPFAAMRFAVRQAMAGALDRLATVKALRRVVGVLRGLG
jgi:hypothetical protein